MYKRVWEETPNPPQPPKLGRHLHHQIATSITTDMAEAKPHPSMAPLSSKKRVASGDGDDERGGELQVVALAKKRQAAGGWWNGDPAQALASARHEFGEHGGVNMSIEASATFTVMEPDTMRRMFAGELGPDRDFYIYSRHFNPTVLNLSRQMAAMEGTEAAYCTASGMSAIASVFLQVCGAGGHVVASQRLYGGTHALLSHFLPRACGIQTTFVDVGDLGAVAAAIRRGDEGAVHGVGCEPDAGGGGRPRAVRGGAREGGDGGGGQHVRAHGDVAGQDGRRRRRPQRLQVHQRRGRHHRRGDMRPGEPGELNDGPAQRGADAAGADHERQGGLRDLGAAAPPGTAHEGALPPRHGLRRAHAQAGPPGGVPGPPRPPPPRALQVPGQPRLRLRRHAVPGHGHGGARQPAHAPPPEHHPVRPHGRQPRLLRDPHVLLRQQHLQRDEPRGEGPRRHLPRPRPHVHRLQRHPRPALDPVREGPHLGAAGPRCLPPPPQELAT